MKAEQVRIDMKTDLAEIEPGVWLSRAVVVGEGDEILYAAKLGPFEDKESARQNAEVLATVITEILTVVTQHLMETVTGEKVEIEKVKAEDLTTPDKGLH